MNKQPRDYRRAQDRVDGRGRRLHGTPVLTGAGRVGVAVGPQELTGGRLLDLDTERVLARCPAS